MQDPHVKVFRITNFYCPSTILHADLTFGKVAEMQFKHSETGNALKWASCNPQDGMHGCCANNPQDWEVEGACTDYSDEPPLLSAVQQGHHMAPGTIFWSGGLRRHPRPNSSDFDTL